MIDLKKEIEILKQERDYYKNILVKNKIEFKPFEYVETPKLTTTEKIEIYMDYFKGRTEVFAERWESKDKSGYSPVCSNKFIYGVCNIQKYKCKNCPNQVYKQSMIIKRSLCNFLKKSKSFNIRICMCYNICV